MDASCDDRERSEQSSSEPRSEAQQSEAQQSEAEQCEAKTQEAADIVSSAFIRTNRTNYSLPRSVIFKPECRRTAFIGQFDRNVLIVKQHFLTRVSQESNYHSVYTKTVDAVTGEITNCDIRLGCNKDDTILMWRKLYPNSAKNQILPTDFVDDIAELQWEFEGGIRGCGFFIFRDKGLVYRQVPHAGGTVTDALGAGYKYHDICSEKWSENALKSSTEYSNEWLRVKGSITHVRDKKKVYDYDIAGICGHIALGVKIDGHKHKVYWHTGDREPIYLGEHTNKQCWREVLLLSWRVFVVEPHHQVYAII